MPRYKRKRSYYRSSRKSVRGYTLRGRSGSVNHVGTTRGGGRPSTAAMGLAGTTGRDERPVGGKESGWLATVGVMGVGILVITKTRGAGPTFR